MIDGEIPQGEAVLGRSCCIASLYKLDFHSIGEVVQRVVGTTVLNSCKYSRLTNVVVGDDSQARMIEINPALHISD